MAIPSHSHGTFFTGNSSAIALCISHRQMPELSYRKYCCVHRIWIRTIRHSLRTPCCHRCGLYVRHYPCCRCHSVPQPYIAPYRGDDAGMNGTASNMIAANATIAMYTCLFISLLTVKLLFGCKYMLLLLQLGCKDGVIIVLTHCGHVCSLTH